MSLALGLLCGVSHAKDGQIDIVYLPYYISESGSYVVVKDLTLTTQNTHGITISADDVSIDLNGHTLQGPGHDQGSTGNGIFVSSIRRNITVRNGTLRDWRENGLHAFDCVNGQFENLCCDSNGAHGLIAGVNCKIMGNTCTNNTGTGIFARSGCVVSNNTSGGNHGTLSNPGRGIYAVDGCTITNNACQGNYSEGSSAWAYGIDAARGCTITNNTCRGNEAKGENGRGVGIKFGAGCLVSGNTCQNNKGTGAISYGTGLYTDSAGSVVRNNVCNDNDGVGSSKGIYTQTAAEYNRFEGNHCSQHDTGTLGHGFYIMGDYNILLSNSGSDSTTYDFQFASGANYNYTALNLYDGAWQDSGTNNTHVTSGDHANTDYVP
jgi:parallel beta-helix repeat protein